MIEQKLKRNLRPLVISVVLMLVVLSLFVLSLLRAKDADLDTPQLKIRATSYVSDLQFTSDGQALVSLEADHSVYLRSVSDGKLIQRFETNGKYVDSIALHPSEPWLAASASDGVVWLWNYETGQVLKQFIVPVNSVPTIAFSPNGQYMAAGVGNSFASQPSQATGLIIVWQLTNFSQVLQIDLSRAVRDLAFTYDSNNIISNNGWHPFSIWSVADGSLLKDFSEHQHTDGFWNMELAQNGSYLIAHEADTIYSWKQNSDYLGHIGRLPNFVCSLAISTHRQFIASGSCQPSREQPYL